ncbi:MULTISPECIES: hypothetical protein [Cronobacter]|uniref:hypothetical protein n=1 Tax=Cronobacter TaxID=413496 RepID=UPI0024C21398|nr:MULTISPECIES: hypothetical protein [Cronobacter]MDK1186929.1 hypothetical protein [Cronobacter turicensis]MDK1191331.1 hypothetical protein [Cronobacter dublinensis]MDK1201970.1 hypothetical protein [Cronobacter dublinensis]MDK1216744.1 hypothetical protein [Cronobacter turicensis]MDK1220658.1 hypothetical protein [Cronobacter turicensis]
MRFIKSTLILLSSVLTVLHIDDGHANIKYYGILKGGDIIEFKSPVSGVVSLVGNKEGDIKTKGTVFDLESIENNAKIDLLNLKIKKTRALLLQKKNEYNEAYQSYKLGYISKNELDLRANQLNDAEIELKQLHIELSSIIKLKNLSNPYVNDKFIIRNLYVNDGQYVNTNEPILKIEKIDKYHVNIKVDPLVLGDIKNHDIRAKSLVSGEIFKARLLKVNSDDSGNSATGMKIITLLIEPQDVIINDNLLDTAFEIIIND